MAELKTFCINCNIKTHYLQKHNIEADDLKIISKLLEWNSVHEIPNDSVLCHACWLIVNKSTQEPEKGTPSRTMGHLKVCICCGRSAHRLRTHVLLNNIREDKSLRSVIREWILPRQLRVVNHLCHSCWWKAKKAVDDSPIITKTTMSTHLRGNRTPPLTNTTSLDDTSSPILKTESISDSDSNTETAQLPESPTAGTNTAGTTSTTRTISCPEAASTNMTIIVTEVKCETISDTETVIWE